MKVITITDKGWIASLPKIQRPVIMHRIANLTVRVAGNHYGENQRP